jgi:hypothetical protein
MARSCSPASWKRNTNTITLPHSFNCDCYWQAWFTHFFNYDSKAKGASVFPTMLRSFSKTKTCMINKMITDQRSIPKKEWKSQNYQFYAAVRKAYYSLSFDLWTTSTSCPFEFWQQRGHNLLTLGRIQELFSCPLHDNQVMFFSLPYHSQVMFSEPLRQPGDVLLAPIPQPGDILLTHDLDPCNVFLTPG